MWKEDKWLNVYWFRVNDSLGSWYTHEYEPYINIKPKIIENEKGQYDGISLISSNKFAKWGLQKMIFKKVAHPKNWSLFF